MVGYGYMSSTTSKTAAGAEVRLCAHEECETRLSRYNEYSFCSLHQPMVTPRTRGRIID